jgi:hypothetical protein
MKLPTSITLYCMLLTLLWFALRPGYCDDTPIVVLREDDIRPSWRTPFPELDNKSALQYGMEKRIPITWGVVTDFAGTSSGLSYIELRDYLNAAGGELASHSVKHAAMANADQYIAELVNSKAIIEQNVPGHICRTFLQPGTWTGEAYLDLFSELDNSIGQALQATYSQSMAYLGGGWRVGDTYYWYGTTNTGSIDFQSYATVQSVYALLDVIAATPGLVFVFSCHGVQASEATQNYNVQANVLKAFMDKASQLRNENKIRLMGLNDAYNATFSLGLNLIVDPGFQVSDMSALGQTGPWNTGGGAVIQPNNGVGYSRYALIPPNGRFYQYMNLTPGRYILRWKQRNEPGGSTAQSLSCYVASSPNNVDIYSLNAPMCTNSAQNIWENKEALFIIPERALPNRIVFRTFSGATASFGIDDVSLTISTLDPQISPTGTTLEPIPSGLRIAWRSPHDTNTTSIMIRSGDRRQPATLSEGTLLRTIPAEPGSAQSVEIEPINWNSQSYLYVSVFAVKADGSASDPDLAFLKVDNTPPQMTILNVVTNNAMMVTANWLASDAESGVYGYEYAVGSNQGGGDIVPWTFSESTSVELTSIPHHNESYLTVRALNPYGYRSSSLSTKLEASASIADIFKLEEGTEVIATGIVSAKFADCFYLEQPDRVRGIKIMGTTPNSLGQQVSVSGELATLAGERCIIPN